MVLQELGFVNKKHVLMFIITIFLLLFFLSVSRGFAPRMRQLILKRKYKAARAQLGELSPSREKLFLRAYLNFKQNNYFRARKYFSRVVDRYPDSVRALDSLYYLDRFNLYPEVRLNSPPVIKVLLDRAKSFEGKVLASYKVQKENNKNLFALEKGDSWRVKRMNGKLEFSAAGKEVYGKKIRLEVRSEKSTEGSFFYDNSTYRGEIELSLADNKIILVNKLSLNKYLYGVIKKEIAPGWPLETVKAQAVASRSFALYNVRRNKEKSFDLGADHFSQLYGGRAAETSKSRQAVELTKGEVLTFKGKVVPAYFHSNSGGHIESGEKIWAGDGLGFIKAHADTWSENTQHSTWDISLQIDKVKNCLAKIGTRKPASHPRLAVKSALPSGRALTLDYVTPRGSYVTVPADEFRKTLGTEKIRSNWIVEIKREGSRLFFKGKGWGHGVGMSQWGAYEMGRVGLDYRSILNFYYSRAKLSENYGPAGSTVRF